jgi:sporulation-control protein
MFKKWLSSIGLIGGAKVDTRLVSESFVPGEQVSGEVLITGGEDAQEFDKIYLAVVTYYKHDDSVHEHAVVHHDAEGHLSVGPGEERAIPFSFALPHETPLSLGSTAVSVKTGLEIPNAIDPSDTDEIRVAPTPMQQAVLEAANSLGFHLQQVENEYNPRKGAPLPFVQQLEFRPRGGRYAGHVEELELVLKQRASELEVLVELDRQARSVGGFLESAMEMNERFDVLRITPADVQQGTVDDKLARLIEHHAR